MQNSYQGGYTQAFVIGQIPSEQQAFYFDYNSMYPAIMSKLKVPTDLTQAYIIEQEPCEINSSNLYKLGLNMSQDPIAEH